MRTENNIKAYEAGAATTYTHPDDAFNHYRTAVKQKKFKPSITASVCFVAGYLGNDFPDHNQRGVQS